MRFTEVASFEVVHDKLAWPWLSVDARGRRFAFGAPESRVATRVVEHDRITEGPSFALPPDLARPSAAPAPEPVVDARPGLHGLSLSPQGDLLAITGVTTSGGAAASVLVTLGAEGEHHRSALEALAGPGFIAQAVAFDRSGARLWVSAESETETALLLLDAETHAPLGITRSAPFAPPAMHELYLHPHEDAVLLLAACGPDGTFARVARLGATGLEAVWTSLQGGGIPAGMVGFSPDGTRLFLAEADELRTHAWPDLKELSSVQFDDDFVSSYSGVVIGERVLVDGQDSESNQDAVTAFDPTGTRGAFLTEPVPTGMWAGRLGADLLITVEAKGEPARGSVLRVTP